MKTKRSFVNIICGIAFVMIMTAILVGIPVVADKSFAVHKGIDVFSENWKLPDGKKVVVDNLNTADYGGKIVIEKRLSNGIVNKDALCFKSQNVNVKVYINDKEVYRFTSRPNLTGYSYGIAFHEVGLSKNDAGCVVRIEYKKTTPNYYRGRIFSMYLCSASDYIQIGIRNNIVSVAFCIITIFIGLVFFVSYYGASNKGAFPFDILAIGACAVMMGLWLLIDTNVIQLLTGHIYVLRDINNTLPFMVAYPSICFHNSNTEKKRPIYNYLGFLISLIALTAIIACRYFFNLDMLYSFPRFIAVYTLVSLAVSVTLAIENSVYCKRIGVKNRLTFIFLTGLLFLGGIILDLAQYLIVGGFSESRGTFTRIGMTIYVLIMLIEFLRWWMKDNADVERDRFINRALQYALSANSPDVSIRSMIEFIGKELNARRVFIFEDQKNGKYRGTYEWYSEGNESFSLDLMYLPAQGIVDKLYEEFNNNDHSLIIRDVEVYKNTLPEFYTILKTNNIDNMIISPMEVRGHLFGVCGVVGAPQKKLESVSDIINLITYFLAQLVLQREEQSRSLFYTYKDVLSGTGNYLAFKKYIEHDLDMSSAFGFIRCDLSSLDEINISEGYEVGDQIVVVAAKLLMEVFGEENVFRMNGTQFIAFGFETEEVYFENDVARLKKMFKENAIEANVSSVYCLYGTKDINIVLNRADDLINKKWENQNEHTDNS